MGEQSLGAFESVESGRIQPLFHIETHISGLNTITLYICDMASNQHNICMQPLPFCCIGLLPPATPCRARK